MLQAVAPFLPAHRAPTNQGTDKAIEHRTYGLDGITAITMGGESYRIRDTETPTPKVTPAKRRKVAGKVGPSFMAGASVKPFGTDGPIGDNMCKAPDYAGDYDRARNAED